MALINELKEYIPFNKQEEIDKKHFIKFLEKYNDCYTRDNTFGHVTSSCWVLNKQHSKVLMCYHNIYDSYSWFGGHNDGIENCLVVALKELNEESGLKNITVLNRNIFSIEILDVKEHVKNGKEVKQHKHYNVTYLFECDENDELHTKDDENKDLKWFAINELKNNIKEVEMYKNIYSKLILKTK